MIPLTFDREGLLLEAHARVTTRRDLAAAGQRLGAAQAELAACIARGWSCVRALARPAAAVLPVSPSDLADMVPEREADGVEAAASFAYLATCGYDSRDALCWLDGDYASYHFQDAFARELVYALGREVARSLRAAHPDLQFRRVVLGGAEAAGGAGTGPIVHRWDPAAVAELLRRLGGGALGVTTVSRGSLAPLHSLLGVMTGEPQASFQTVNP